MSRIADARTQLAAAIGVLWQPDRVHDITPNRVDAPCVFLAGASVDTVTTGAQGIQLAVVTFPVYCVADGRPDQQTRALDELIAVVWDAALAAGGHPLDATPAAIDVGGPSLRGAVVRVELNLAALTLCTPSLQEATHG